MAATIGLVQTDIKRVLAYSTVSQLGYMFVAAGVGAFSAGIFHLMTHAFFKALLFLGAGSVIHAMGGEQDLMRMGGLRRYTPITFWTMLIAALAISGIFPLAGFFSKDEILWSAWSHGHPFVWFFGFITAGLTAFYMFRLIFLAFFGEARYSEEARHHLHESPSSMTVPLIVLGISVHCRRICGIAGWMDWARTGFSSFSNRRWHLLMAHGTSRNSLTPSNWDLPRFRLLVAAAGIYLAYRIYVAHPDAAEALAARLQRDSPAVVSQVLCRRTVRCCHRESDGQCFNRMCSGNGPMSASSMARSTASDDTIQGLASILKNVQNGLIRSYAAWILLGAVAILLYISIFRS